MKKTLDHSNNYQVLFLIVITSYAGGTLYLDFRCMLIFYSFVVNYINSWKPVGVLKGDGSQVSSEIQRLANTTTSGNQIVTPSQTTARYIKLGSITQTRDGPRH